MHFADLVIMREALLAARRGPVMSYYSAVVVNVVVHRATSACSSAVPS